MKGREFMNILQDEVKRLVDHILRVSYEKFRIVRFVAYYKIDKKGTLIFMYASSIRLESDKESMKTFRAS